MVDYGALSAASVSSWCESQRGSRCERWKQLRGQPAVSVPPSHHPIVLPMTDSAECPVLSSFHAVWAVITLRSIKHNRP